MCWHHLAPADQVRAHSCAEPEAWDALQVQTVRGDAAVAIERAEARASEERRRAAAREAELAQRCEELGQRVEQLQVGAWWHCWWRTCTHMRHGHGVHD